jgi:hypothetical protein
MFAQNRRPVSFHRVCQAEFDRPSPFHAQRSAERRKGVKGYTSQTNAPGNEPTAMARPKDTEKSSAFSGAIP